MKDLYTFDLNSIAAEQTYDEVSRAYEAIFKTFGLPYVVARADSGNMGGKMSHEYHFLTPQGEDNLVICSHCGYCANEELAEKKLDFEIAISSAKDLNTWLGITRDRKALVIAFAPSSSPGTGTESPGELNIHSLVRAVHDLDLSIEDPIKIWNAEPVRDDHVDHSSNSRRIRHVYDSRLDSRTRDQLRNHNPGTWLREDLRTLYSSRDPIDEMVATSSSGAPLDLTRIKDGDRCGQCSEGDLQVRRAIEVGHTFHLGTRYSQPLRASIAVSQPAASGIPRENESLESQSEYLQMGCHGIGISRLLGAIASVTSDNHGLQWPRAIAPFDVAILAQEDAYAGAEDIYDSISNSFIHQHAQASFGTIDPVIDDRSRSLIWKLKDADMAGYPVLLILGRAWKDSGKVEMQCRRLGIKKLVAVEDIVPEVRSTLQQYEPRTSEMR
jgi:prolyl-tRNA synthetase